MSWFLAMEISDKSGKDGRSSGTVSVTAREDESQQEANA